MTDRSRWIRITGFLWLAASVLYFGWGTRFRYAESFRTPIWFDEAYNLQIPWHFAHDGKYGASSPRGEIPSVENGKLFDSAVTTGPTFLLPVGVLERFFPGPLVGHGRRVGFLFFALFVLSMPTALLFRSVDPIFVMPALFTTFSIVNEPHWANLSTEILGESPGVTLLCVSTLLWFFGTGTRRRCFAGLAGVIAASAVLSKLLFLVPLAGIVTFFIFARIFRFFEDCERPEAIPFLVGFVSLFFVWEFFQLFQAGGLDGYLSLKRQAFHAFFAVSGGPTIHTPIGGSEWRMSTMRKLALVGSAFASRGVLTVIALSFGIIGIFAPIRVWFFRKGVKASSRAGWSALLWGALAYHAWFILLSPTGWQRHYIPAWVMFEVGAFGLFFEWASSRVRAPFLASVRVAFRNIFLGVALITVAIRFLSPIRGALAEQYQIEMRLAEVNRVERPEWVTQSISGDENTFSLFLETGEIPENAFREGDRAGGFCGRLLPRKDLRYALVNESDFVGPRPPEWRCGGGAPSALGSSRFELEICRGQDLECR